MTTIRQAMEGRKESLAEFIQMQQGLLAFLESEMERVPRKVLDADVDANIRIDMFSHVVSVCVNAQRPGVATKLFQDGALDILDRPLDRISFTEFDTTRRGCFFVTPSRDSDAGLLGTEISINYLKPCNRRVIVRQVREYETVMCGDDPGPGMEIIEVLEEAD